jgi:hypothetical protein
MAEANADQSLSHGTAPPIGNGWQRRRREEIRVFKDARAFTYSYNVISSQNRTREFGDFRIYFGAFSTINVIRYAVWFSVARRIEEFPQGLTAKLRS